MNILQFEKVLYVLGVQIISEACKNKFENKSIE